MASPALIESISDLRQRMPAADGETVQTRYYRIEGYGGGYYTHDASDTSSEDNGGSVIVSSSGARYKRQWEDGEVGNVLFWGADPSGQTSSSEAFQRLSDSELVRTIKVPEFGEYAFDTTVNLSNNLTLKGEQWTHFSRSIDRSVMKAMDALDGPIFANAYHVFGLAFFGPSNPIEGNDYHALGIDGYCCQIVTCSFYMYYFDAIRAPKGVDVTVRDSMFNKCDTCLNIGVVNGAANTLIRFIRNECQYSNFGVVSAGELWGSVISDNVWEVCNNALLIGKTIFNTRIEGNWIERGGDSENPIKVIQSSDYQQISNCFAAGNSFHYSSGWIDTISPEPGHNNNAFGGVNVDNGHVTIAGSAGTSTAYDMNGIAQYLDSHAGLNDYTITTASNTKGATGFTVESKKGIELQAANGLVTLSEGENEHSRVTLRYPQRVVSDTDVDSYIEMGPSNNGQFRADIPVENTDPGATDQKKIGYAIAGMPYFMNYQGVYSAGNATGDGMPIFDIVEDKTTYLALYNNHLEFRNPIIMITVHNPDIRYSHWTPISAYGSSWSAYKVCKGVRLFFLDRSTGGAVIPSAGDFTMSMLEGYDR